MLFAQVQPKLGLALSGGGAKGLAHIGVLEELEKAGIYADVVSGTSMGSIVGGLYAIGYTPDEVKSIAANINWAEYFSDSYPSIYIPIEQRYMTQEYQLSFPIDSSGIILPKGVLQGKKIQTLLSLLFTPAQHQQSFDDFPKPFRAVATDMENGTPYIFKDGVLSKAIRASMAIPSFFAPVNVKDSIGKERLLADGLVVRNLPTQEAIDLGADFVIAVDVGAPLAKRKDLNNLITILQQTTDFGSIKLNEIQRSLADAVLDPDLGAFTALSYDAADSIVSLGAAAASSQIPRIVRQLESNGFSIPMERPQKVKIKKDSFNVTSIKFEADQLATRTILKRLFKIKVPGIVTNQALQQQINKLYGSNFFESVDFVFSPSEGGSELTIKATATPKWRMGLNGAFDSDYEPSVLINLSGRNVIGNGSLLSMDARISEFPRASIQYLLYTQTKPSIGIRLSADANFYPGRLYERNELTSEYRAHHFRSHLGLFSGIGENRYLETGLYSEQLSSNAKFISLASTNNVFNQQALYLKVIRNTYDRATFPQKGSKASIYISQSISGKERISDTEYKKVNNNLIVTARYNSVIPLNKSWATIVDIAGGFIQHRRRNILNQLYLGRPLANEAMFFNVYGRRHMETPASGFIGLSLGLRAAISSSTFIGLHYQGGSYATVASNLISFNRALLNPDRASHNFQGIGLVLGVKTFLGPIQFNSEYNPNIGKTNFNLHFGYYF